MVSSLFFNVTEAENFEITNQNCRPSGRGTPLLRTSPVSPEVSMAVHVNRSHPEQFGQRPDM